MIRLSVVFWPLTVVMTVALLGWMLLAFLVGNVRTSALAVSVLSVAALSEATFATIGAELHFPAAIVFIPAAAVLLCIVLLQLHGSVEGLTVFANVLFVSLFVLVAWPLVSSEIRNRRSPTALLPPLEVPAPSAGVRRPDVYVLVLDGYGRADVLRDYYHLDSDLVRTLEAMGFFVGSEASSNYAQTAQSLASSLNLDYLPSLLPESGSIWTRVRLADLIGTNRTFETFKAAGYRVRAFASEYSLLRPGPADERPHPLVYLNDFDFGLYEGTILPLLSQAVGLTRGWAPFILHRHHIRWTLQQLLQADVPRSGDPPTLTFAHLLIPHPPFVFEEDGRSRRTRLPATFNDAGYWRARAGSGPEKYEDGYADAVRFLNPQIAEMMRRLASRTDRPSIWYIQGDHGPGSRLEWEDPLKTDVRERFGILLAVRFPDGAGVPLDKRTTPVNAMRALLNRALGTRLTPLDDRNYFSTWLRPSEYVDVTERVRQ